MLAKWFRTLVMLSVSEASLPFVMLNAVEHL